MTITTPHATALSALAGRRPVDAAPAPILRAVTSSEREAVASFFSELSPQSSFLRFFTGGFRVTDAALDTLMCRTTVGRAFVAVEEHRVVGHAMWCATRHGPQRVEIAFVVAEDRRGQGLGHRLTRLAITDAVRGGAQEIEATVLAANWGARRLITRLLPCATSSVDHGEISYLARTDRGWGTCLPAAA